MRCVTRVRRAAEAVVGWSAARLEFTSREAWGRAMRAELDHIDGDLAALRWACGCALAVMRLRRRDMDFGTLRVSRFVLALEMALAFGPATFGWYDVMFGMSGVVWLDMATIERYYLARAEDVAVLAMLIVWAVAGLAGPIGLIVAARHILLGETLKQRWLSAALLAGPIAVGAAYLAANLVMGSEWSVSRIGFYILFVVVPLAGVLHLRHLGRSQPNRAPAVA